MQPSDITEDDDRLASRDACRLLGVSQRTLDRFIADERLPVTYLPNGHRRYRRADVLALLSSRQSA